MGPQRFSAGLTHHTSPANHMFSFTSESLSMRKMAQCQMPAGRSVLAWARHTDQPMFIAISWTMAATVSNSPGSSAA